MLAHICENTLNRTHMCHHNQSFTLCNIHTQVKYIIFRRTFLYTKCIIDEYIYIINAPQLCNIGIHIVHLRLHKVIYYRVDVRFEYDTYYLY